VTHYLNGVKVLEYQRAIPRIQRLGGNQQVCEMENFWRKPKKATSLQDHGDEVSFQKHFKIKTLN